MSEQQTYPNAGPNADLSKYRTGETPMVGDVVRWHGHIFSDDMGTVDPPAGTMVESVGIEGQLFFNHRYHGGAWWYAYRFDLISRAVVTLADSPDAGKMVEAAPEPTLLEAAERYVAWDSIENFRALKAAVGRAKGGG